MSSKPTKREGRLSVLGTPIGNLEDITLRALRVLREADTVVAEDTRRTRALCNHHGVTARLESFHAHSSASKVQALVEAMRGGAHVALVTDAGTPVVSDPGTRLVSAAAEAGVPVEAVPGPSAVTAALSVSGLRCDTFRFVGFLPRSGGRRRRLLEAIASDGGATVLFEAKNRLAPTLRDLSTHLAPDRRLAVCRELTKVHEEVATGTAAELAERFASGTLGEVTLVVEAIGEEAARQAAGPPDEGSVERRVRALLGEGLGPAAVARQVAAETGVPRKTVYLLVLRQQEETL